MQYSPVLLQSNLSFVKCGYPLIISRTIALALILLVVTSRPATVSSKPMTVELMENSMIAELGIRIAAGYQHTCAITASLIGNVTISITWVDIQ
jgi:hypothetical protein